MKHANNWTDVVVAENSAERDILAAAVVNLAAENGTLVALVATARDIADNDHSNTVVDDVVVVVAAVAPEHIHNPAHNVQTSPRLLLHNTAAVADDRKRDDHILPLAIDNLVHLTSRAKLHDRSTRYLTLHTHDHIPGQLPDERNHRSSASIQRKDELNRSDYYMMIQWDNCLRTEVG